MRNFPPQGIPFAAPPVGKLRWEAPEPIPRRKDNTCWAGTLKTKTAPPMCTQKSLARNVVSGQEDCLYLNVMTPTLNTSAGRNVMVFFHGGYLQWGMASWPGYSPDVKLAQELGYVQVSVQYRLAGFGYLVFDALPGTGNYGILDQIAALQWVQRNIAQFGGDPNKACQSRMSTQRL
ncbi:hypothetical protein CAPTEDRAFT_143530 [Capitella teleta]|uniref:Carboxylesterase type B domain-containing protein n=1 Tax=Capitella teleta TaxID=283909 RepID=R7VLS4_CAPTE|nr:hypothetical protein CAPTEDRAFT_143530 [Capitella teleta]|eukprot:ELU17860.1 hypothetical protein CAPTEDRAFT_143530 [Capitella teleta]